MLAAYQLGVAKQELQVRQVEKPFQLWEKVVGKLLLGLQYRQDVRGSCRSLDMLLGKSHYTGQCRIL